MFPRLRFNKEGNLLAVATADNGIKILANAVGLRSLRTTEAPSFEASKASVEPTANKVHHLLTGFTLLSFHQIFLAV